MKVKIVKKQDYKELKPIYENFEISEKGDICIAIGGDGTFVRAAKEYSGPILPIRSEEYGSIGYYSDLSLADIDFVVKNLKSKSFTVEKLENKIEVEYNSKKYYAVNEVLLHNVLEEVNFKIYEIKNGKREEIYPYTMSGDGILVTSSIGSTAYNKSAGGPLILIPNAICLTFLNVDGPYRNSIVADSSKTIEIEVVKYRGALRYDGIDIRELKPAESFRIRVSNEELKIVRFNNKREALAKKLDRIIRSRMTK
ncbi:MAG: NAD(+)/NADH kinase [Candidatus Micrarchaeota archaeon]|nr:NAD(+)/NADH kinase [Candidatus Micrarchaeota archaeon]